MQPLLWYFNAGGVLMWPLMGLAVLGLAVIIERIACLRRARFIDPAAIDDIQKLVETGYGAQAIDKYRLTHVPTTRLVIRGLQDHSRYGIPVDRALQEAGQREIAMLPNHLGILSMVARIAPLIGLLGTIVGMIDAFAVLEKGGANRAGLIGAVRVALITSAAGLIISVPCLIALSYFKSVIRRLVSEIEEIARAVGRSASVGIPAQPTAAPALAHKDEEHFELPSILSGK